LKEKIIPAFEKAHGPEYQALFMVDNSQGHSAYPADALLVQQMNLGPGGKKPCMQNDWFMRGGEKVSHSMVMPSTDSGSPQPKGIQIVMLMGYLQANFHSPTPAPAENPFHAYAYGFHTYNFTGL